MNGYRPMLFSLNKIENENDFEHQWVSEDFAICVD